VLDRYNTAPDQQFTINLNELPPLPPVLDHAVAANLVAALPTNPTNNVYTAVTVPQTSTPVVTTGLLNRGDFQVKVDGKSLVYTEGILMASVTLHDRSDFLNRHATVEAGRNPYGDGYLSLSLMEAGNAAKNEVNFNTSVAWFPFNSGWQGAHVNGNGTLPGGASQGVTPSMVARTAAGRYQVDLGVDSRTDGLLFAIGNNNENIAVQTGPLADGSGWDVRVADNATNHGATGLDKDWSFVYLPYDTPGLIGGRYDGAASSNLASVGDFTMNRLGTGQYELRIAGETPSTGMLIMTVAHLTTAGLVTAPDDNIMTYQPGPTGAFLINSYDLQTTASQATLSLQDTTFAWAFINFADPISPVSSAGDFDEDGDVDGADLLEWQRNIGAMGADLPADGNRNGIVDLADLDLWRQNFSPTSGAPPAASQSVPEPAGSTLLLTAAALAWRVDRRRCYGFASATDRVRYA
jgi:hypothetical protein